MKIAYAGSADVMPSVVIPRVVAIPRKLSASSAMMSVTSVDEGEEAAEIVKSATRPCSVDAVTPYVLAAAIAQPLEGEGVVGAEVVVGGDDIHETLARVDLTRPTFERAELVDEDLEEIVEEVLDLTLSEKEKPIFD